ncbi:(2Fe-2S)-binding protein [Streptomyces sp. NPDC055036]
MSDPLICLCARVTEGELIRAAARWSGDTEAIGEATGAGTGCGDCVDEVAEIAASSLSRQAVPFPEPTVGDATAAVRHTSDIAPTPESRMAWKT